MTTNEFTKAGYESVQLPNGILFVTRPEWEGLFLAVTETLENPFEYLREGGDRITAMRFALETRTMGVQYH